MNALTRFKMFLWYFGRAKVPLIGHLKPKIISLSDEKLVVLLPLSRRSKNHLNSMYFGALAVGADLAGGLHAFYHAETAKVKLSLAFKSFNAQFIKRPESDVYFVFDQGLEVQQMIAESKSNGERINKVLPIKAYVHYEDEDEADLVAEFLLELSLKVIN